MADESVQVWPLSDDLTLTFENKILFCLAKLAELSHIPFRLNVSQKALRLFPGTFAAVVKK